MTIFVAMVAKILSTKQLFFKQPPEITGIFNLCPMLCHITIKPTHMVHITPALKQLKLSISSSSLKISILCLLFHTGNLTWSIRRIRNCILASVNGTNLFSNLAWSSFSVLLEPVFWVGQYELFLFLVPFVIRCDNSWGSVCSMQISTALNTAAGRTRKNVLTILGKVWFLRAKRWNCRPLK